MSNDIITLDLGFLSTFKKEDVRKVVQEFVQGAYTVVERSLVEVTKDSDIPEFSDLNFAFNEVTVSRKDTTSMITVETLLNNEYLTSYWADGLIISTPTGSTGYSLSCNGPVILPNAKNLVITPIAPHNLNARPMVIADNTSIQLEVDSRDKDFAISIDSKITSVPKNTKIFIEKTILIIKRI